MGTDLQEAVSATVIEILEQLTFMFGDQMDTEELPQPDGSVVRASMQFSGGVQGSLSLIVAEGSCPELAANILGIEIEELENESHSVDALKETLNVVGGRVVREIGGAEAHFVLTPPEVETSDTASWGVWCSTEGCLGFMLDETPMLFVIETTGGDA